MTAEGIKQFGQEDLKESQRFDQKDGEGSKEVYFFFRPCDPTIVMKLFFFISKISNRQNSCTSFKVSSHDASGTTKTWFYLCSCVC